MEIPEIVRFDIFDIYVHLGSGVLLIGVAVFINNNLLGYLQGLSTVFQIYLIFIAYLLGIMAFPLSIVIESQIWKRWLTRVDKKSLEANEIEAQTWSSRLRRKGSKSFESDDFRDEFEERRETPQRIRSTFGGHPIEAKWIKDIADYLDASVLPGFEKAEKNFRVEDRLKNVYKINELDIIIEYLEEDKEVEDIKNIEEIVESVENLYLWEGFIDFSDRKLAHKSTFERNTILFYLKSQRDLAKKYLKREKYSTLVSEMELQLSAEDSTGTYNKYLARSYLLLTTSLIFTGAALLLFSVSIAYAISSIVLGLGYQFPSIFEGVWMTYGYGPRGALFQVVVFFSAACFAYYLRREEYYSYIGYLAKDYQRLQE